MALLLTVGAWTSDAVPEDTARTAEILTAAGWRIALASSGTPLAAAWQQLHRPADRRVGLRPVLYRALPAVQRLGMVLCRARGDHHRRRLRGAQPAADAARRRLPGHQR